MLLVEALVTSVRRTEKLYCAFVGDWGDASVLLPVWQCSFVATVVGLAERVALFVGIAVVRQIVLVLDDIVAVVPRLNAVFLVDTDSHTHMLMMVAPAIFAKKSGCDPPVDVHTDVRIVERIVDVLALQRCGLRKVRNRPALQAVF